MLWFTSTCLMHSIVCVWQNMNMILCVNHKQLTTNSHQAKKRIWSNKMKTYFNYIFYLPDCRASLLVALSPIDTKVSIVNYSPQTIQIDSCEWLFEHILTIWKWNLFIHFAVQLYIFIFITETKLWFYWRFVVAMRSVSDGADDSFFLDSFHFSNPWIQTDPNSKQIFIVRCSFSIQWQRGHSNEHERS